MTEVTGAMTSRQVIADLFIEGHQTHGIALQVKEVPEGCRQGRSILGLGVGCRPIIHRAALVTQQVAAQVGFVFKFLDEITITSREYPPIQIAWIIVRGVLSALAEFLP